MKIIIPGEPVAQTRMRFTNIKGFSRVYDPCEKVKKQVREKLNTTEIQEFEHPRISFIFHMPIPKSISKKDRNLYQSGVIKHEKKPDVDNLLKLYMDCLDGIFFQGDQRVTLGPCVKLYNQDPKTVIIIQEMSQTLLKQEVDLEMWQNLFSS